jgi:hypothetical protein
MLFQEPPPDTSAYMVAGYVVAFSVMAIYLLSLVVRWRNLNRDLETLETLSREEQSKRPGKAPGDSRKVTPKK